MSLLFKLTIAMQNGLPLVSPGELADPQAALALVVLCKGLLPVWSRHLAACRGQSEAAVTEMLKAFADIRPHINMAERQSQQINDALSQSADGVAGLVGACEQVLAPALQDAQLPASARLAIEQALSMVRTTVGALEEIAKPFQHETQRVAEQVERMYMGFQYQDRTSQMTALLEGDLTRLQSSLDLTAADVPSLAEWLAQLEARYAMAEQHQNHHADSTGSPAADENETTFF